MADILSILAMSYAPESTRDSLKYCLIGSSEPCGSWGHEYVRYTFPNYSYLSSEIIQEWAVINDFESSLAKQIMKLALDIAAFFMTHNAEADACDLLIELEALHHLPALVDKVTYPRVCLYILG
jgi:26S proteasome regulatory subunit N1